VEALIKKIIELRTEKVLWTELSEHPVEDERHKCDPAVWPSAAR